MRDQLLAELAAQTDIRLLTSWAHKALPRKNELRNADAQTVEAAFAVRLCVARRRPTCGHDARPRLK